MKTRRHGWIRTIVKSFADLDLTTRPRDYFDASHIFEKRVETHIKIISTRQK
jgi:hypothetical protein